MGRFGCSTIWVGGASVTYVKPKELRGASNDGLRSLSQFFVVFKHTHDSVLRQLHEFGDWGCIES